MTFRNITGTFDVLPDESESDGNVVPGSSGWRHIEKTVHRVMGLFNMHEIRTPILEPTELVARGVGQLTDIVSKDMFAFERGDTNYVLRPEVTAPVMRAYLQHHLEQRGGVQRLYYIGPCFRAERPQRGRYRQFHQFGAEIIGTPDPRADAETIASMMAVYEELGLKQTRLRINSLGDETTRPVYKEKLRAYLEPRADQLSKTSKERLATNPLRILDTKDEKERKLLEGAPLLVDHIGDEARAYYEDVKRLLADLGIAFEEDPFLVRGLDYYTHTTFELESPNLGAQSALAGGGRYDLLAEELGSSARVPAVGFAAGMERLILALSAEGIALPGAEAPQAFLVALGDEAARRVMGIARDLRRAGVRTGYDLKGRSMKAQMREANRQAAPFAIIIGDNELAAGRAQVKRMDTGEQFEVAFADLPAAIGGHSVADH